MLARHRSKPSLPWHWGAVPPEKVGTSLGNPTTRTLLTRATAANLMVWINQLHRAPYSYDWIDNLGRRSPRIPDSQGVRPGDRLMYIFTVTDRGEQHIEAKMTTWLPRAVFGGVRIRYQVRDYGTVRAIHYTMWTPGRGRIGRLRSYLLAWADLIMARKQLFTLAGLAEETPPCEYDRGTPTKE